MKTLIVCYSYTGNNKTLAHLLQRRLGCDLTDVMEPKGRGTWRTVLDLFLKRVPAILPVTLPPGSYERVILIAPVWARHIAMPMGSFVRQYSGQLGSYGFITVCTGREGQAAQLTGELTKMAGHAPLAVTELWINDLLPPEKRNTIRYATRYRITAEELVHFEEKIAAFLQRVG